MLCIVIRPEVISWPAASETGEMMKSFQNTLLQLGETAQWLTVVDRIAHRSGPTLLADSRLAPTTR